jgi:hypothetical protein
MKIPDFTLDRHGVWTKDEKEEHKGALSNSHSSHLCSNVIIIPKHVIINSQGFLVHSLIMFFFSAGPSKPTKDSSTETTSDITNVNKDGDKATAKEQAGPIFSKDI